MSEKEKCINYPKSCKSRGVINSSGECTYCVKQQAREILLKAIKNDVHNLHNNYATDIWVEKWRACGASYELIAKALNNGITSQDIRRFVSLGIEPVHNEKRAALNLPEMTTVPACPVPGCQETYIHLHGKQTYDPAVQELKPVTKPRKPRPPRNYEGKVWLY